MSKGINVNDKFGVNPTIPVCFYCGKEKNMIALLGCDGYKEKDHTGKFVAKQAPHKMVLDVEPCDECAEKFKDFTILVEMSWNFNVKQDRPTGRHIAIRKSVMPDFLGVQDPPPIMYCKSEDFTVILSHCEGVKDE